jgi:hypothetical protein
MSDKRQIKVKIATDGTINFDNSTNPDEARILKELAELAQMLSGDPKAVKIEKHVHTHANGHTHTHEHVHSN